MISSTLLDLKVMEWIELTEQLSKFKTLEMEARKELALIVLGENKPEAFSETLNLGKGYKLKATQVINFKLDAQDRVEGVIEKLSEMGRSDISGDIFKWKPTLSESAYKKLDSELKLIVDEVVSFNIGSPKLEFIEPKVKS